MNQQGILREAAVDPGTAWKPATMAWMKNGVKVSLTPCRSNSPRSRSRAWTNRVMSASMTVVTCGEVCLLRQHVAGDGATDGGEREEFGIGGTGELGELGLGVSPASSAGSKGGTGLLPRRAIHRQPQSEPRTAPFAGDGRGDVGQHVLLGDASAHAGADHLGQVHAQLIGQAGDGGGDEAKLG